VQDFNGLNFDVLSTTSSSSELRCSDESATSGFVRSHSQSSISSMHSSHPLDPMVNCCAPCYESYGNVEGRLGSSDSDPDYNVTLTAANSGAFNANGSSSGAEGAQTFATGIRQAMVGAQSAMDVDCSVEHSPPANYYGEFPSQQQVHQQLQPRFFIESSGNLGNQLHQQTQCNAVHGPRHVFTVEKTQALNSLNDAGVQYQQAQQLISGSTMGPKSQSFPYFQPAPQLLQQQFSASQQHGTTSMDQGLMQPEQKCQPNYGKR